jgi:hypothetical protein
MPRGIDHLVLASRDLDGARAAFRRLGFTLTPMARHPFGTANSLVQLDGNFLELLGIADRAAIPEPRREVFSFGAFNRDFLKRREGISMLVLKSRDAAADRADFAARGLRTYDPFRFERIAQAPDGRDEKVAFSLTFTSDPRLPDVGFFSCQNHYPENFWRADYQRHENTARGTASAVMVARDPADFHEFLTHFTGQHEIHADSLGIAFDLGEGRIEVLSPVAFRAWFGEAAPIEDDPVPRLMAARIAVADLAATRAVLERNGVPFAARMGQLVVPASAACGAVIAFAGPG